MHRRGADLPGAPTDAGAEADAAGGTAPAAIYDYQAGAIERVEVASPAGRPSAEALVQAARAAYEDFDGQVKARHRLLRTLFQKAMQREDAAPMPVKRDTAKIGRNDPCPCGSGAKYKKCCGVMETDGEDD